MEKKIVLNQEVEKVIDFLQKSKFVYNGKIKTEKNKFKWNLLILPAPKI